MGNLSKQFLLLFVIGGLVIFSGCSNNDNTSTLKDFGVFTNQSETTVVINGVIGSNTPEQWDSYISQYPQTKMMIMKNCPGSEDDESNLEVSRKMRSHGLEIHLMSDAIIASGATDMFFAGIKRTRDIGSQIGVHSWSDGTNEATSFPVGHANHSQYINYYIEMGLTQQEAEDFYYFTINAAPAADIHWMTDAEINRYRLLTE